MMSQTDLSIRELEEALQLTVEAPARVQERIELLIKLAWRIKFTDARRSHDLAAESATLSENTGAKKDLAESRRIQGIALYFMGNYEPAHEHLTAAVEGFRAIGHKQGEADSVSGLGYIHDALGNHEAALECFLNNLQFSEQSGDLEGQASALNSIGIIYSKVGNFAKSVECHLQSHALNEASNSAAGMAVALVNAGIVYKKLGDYSKALTSFQTSLIVFEREANRTGIATCLTNSADVQSLAGNTDAALESYHRALPLAIETENRYVQAGVLLGLGKLHERLNHIDESLAWLNRALSVAEAIQSKQETMETHEALSRVYRRTGNLEKALHHYERFHLIKEEMFNEASDRRVKGLQIQFQTERTQRESERRRIESEQRQTEAEQRRMEAELYRLKNVELIEVNHRLEEANRLKMELLGIAAHDLKNPLQTIIGFAELTKEIASSAEIIEYQACISGASGRMVRLIDNLLKSAAIESGKMTFETTSIDLGNLAGRVAKHCESLALKKSQRLTLDLAADCIVFGDAERLSEVLENLISNAIKYSPEGKQIALCVRRQSGSVRLEVKDEGLGMSEEDKEKVFGKFQRLSARPTGGESTTGLGLSIVKQIIELHGGRVWAESAGKGKGSAFYVELPAAVSQVAAGGEGR